LAADRYARWRRIVASFGLIALQRHFVANCWIEKRERAAGAGAPTAAAAASATTDVPAELLLRQVVAAAAEAAAAAMETLVHLIATEEPRQACNTQACHQKEYNV
jgi:hypothetical protein